jgi:hypothetical protein
MKRTALRVAGISDTATTKREIQAVVRDIVIIRDGGCILRDIRLCGGGLGNDVVLQADHLITRSNSATYADTRLIVCLCKSCHAWKSIGSKREYDEMVKTILPADRVTLWEACERDSWKPKRTTAYDWSMELVALKQELGQLTAKPRISGTPAEQNF